jgi:serine/threonine protein kinase/tetratricopeptide (TPR) repeat protein
VTDPAETSIPAVGRVCAKCGSKIFADAPQGFCSLCLFQTALGPLEDESDDVRESSRPNLDTEFDDYELLQEIGRGGQAVVYRARQKSLNRTVALKVIGLGRWATEAHLKRFRLEAEAAASLNHPSIVPIHDIGEHDGCCYFSMNLIDGRRLDEIVGNQPMSVRRAADLVTKLARTVHYAHERGILHRDIKPGNILIDGNDEPHLTDFGLARLVETESTVTRTSEFLGTPSYMAPEQAAGKNDTLTRATDVYALGAVLYQLLTGRPPFLGASSYETVRLLLDTDPPRPRLLNPKADRDLSTICMKCLEKEPQRRYDSALALAQDLERWSRREPIRARRSGPLRRGGKWLRRNPIAAVSAVLILGLIAALGVIISKTDFIRRPPTNAIAASDKSIAVLPFANVSDDKTNTYFVDGIQDEILSRLSKIAELKVISRTSTEKYKDSRRNLREIGQQLGVANILEGAVQKSGDQVRITVQLINASTDSHLWADTYDRKLIDVFGVESEVAQRIASSLQAKLTGSAQRAIDARPTENTQAHQLYLKGRFFWNKRTGADLQTAAEYFQQAISADPRYANAYAGLAQATLLMPFYNAGASQDVFPKAKAAATRAIELDESSPEGHAALAMLLCYDFKLRESEAEFKRAIELDPNYATAHHWYGNTLLTTVGRFDEAIKEGKRAVELDPFSLIINADLGSTLMLARRYDEAIVQLRATLALDGNFAYAHGTLGSVLFLKGDVNAAISEYEKVRTLIDSCDVFALLGLAYAKIGRTPEIPQLLQELNECGHKRYVRNHVYALMSIALGQKETAINYLEKSSDNWLRIDPLLDPLRDEPRFQKLVAKVFPPAAP